MGGGIGVGGVRVGGLESEVWGRGGWGWSRRVGGVGVEAKVGGLESVGLGLVGVGGWSWRGWSRRGWSRGLKLGG